SQLGARMTRRSMCVTVGKARGAERSAPRTRPLTGPRYTPNERTTMKIALLQVNPTVGDVAGNARRILEALRQAAAAGADLAATPELALVGYLPRDLLLSAGFVRKSWDVLETLARDAADLPPVLVGLPEPNPSDEG